MPHYIGMDIGGTKIEGILVDEKLEVLKKYQLPTLAKKKREATITNIVAVAKQLMTKNVRGIGISMAGRINRKGIITFNPNIPRLVGVNAKQLLQKKLKTRIAMENDAACFALAEHRLGAGKGTRNMIGMIMGTGIGTGLIINGKLYKGNGGAGELGHMTIDPSGPRCGCGKKGDLESWCSGKHIVERYAAAGGKMKSPDPAKIFASKEKTARKVMAETIDKLGMGLANMTAAFDPDAIILGGGVSNLPFYAQIRAAAEKYKYQGQKSKTKIRKGNLKSSGAIGAALLCTS